MITIYGLKNCDTCRKAKKWLDGNGLDHQFHDVRADGLEASTLSVWADAIGWEKLLNRRGTTWRKLSDDEKNNLDDHAAQALMVAHPALVKRPVFEFDGQYTIGFDATVQALLKGSQQ